MNAKIFFTFLLSCIVFFPINAYVVDQDSDQEIYFQLIPAVNDGTNPDEIPVVIDPEKGVRTPMRTFVCNISKTYGIHISNIGPSEICSFEIYNESGSCINMTTLEEEFIETIFSITGVFKIHIHTTQCILIGYISL